MRASVVIAGWLPIKTWHALPTCPAEHAGNFNTPKQALHGQQFSLVHAGNFLPVPMLDMADHLEFPAHGLGCQADI